MEKELPIYRIEIDELNIESGVDFISLVDEPAMEVDWMAFSKKNQTMEFKADKDKKMLYGVFIIPDKKIERYHPDGNFYVVFEKDQIEKIVRKYNKNNLNRNVNFQHGDNIVDAYVVENFITSDRIKANFGFEIPNGAWVGSIYVESDEFWETYVKTETVRGFSIQMRWDKLTQLNMSSQDNTNDIHDEMLSLMKSDCSIEELYNKLEVLFKKK